MRTKSATKRRRPLSKTECIARLHRGLRPKLDGKQLFDLAMVHHGHLDVIAHGGGNVDLLVDWAGSVLTWSKVAELLDTGTTEMTDQLRVVASMVERFNRSGKVGFSGSEYQTAKLGVGYMGDLAELVDRPTAIKAADWSESTLQGLMDSNALDGNVIATLVGSKA